MKFLLSLVENDKALGDHSSDDGDVLLKIKILSFGMLEYLFFFILKLRISFF